MSEIKLWWSHKNDIWEKRNFDLKRIPTKYRCPTCGKILVKPYDRDHLIRDWADFREKRKKIKELLAIEQPLKEEFNNFCEKHKELFTPKLVPAPEYPIIELSFYGGVCQKCWLDGLGNYGKVGAFFNYMTKKANINQPITATPQLIK